MEHIKSHTLADEILQILKGNGDPMTSSQVQVEFVSKNPGWRIGKSSITASISSAIKRGLVEKASSPGQRDRYRVRSSQPHLPELQPLLPIAMAKEAGDAPESRLPTPQGAGKAAPYNTVVAIPIVKAIIAAIQSEDPARIREFANHALDAFCVDRPWMENGFFWVYCQGVNVVRISVVATKQKNPNTFDDLVRLRDGNFESIRDPIVIRDGGYRSSAAGLKSSYFSTTAIVWFLVNLVNKLAGNPDDAQRADIDQFYSYARGHYIDVVDAARPNIVDVYRDIHSVIMDRRLRGTQNELALHDVKKSTGIQSVRTAGEIRDASWTEDGGLNVLLHFPRDIAEGLLRQMPVGMA